MELSLLVLGRCNIYEYALSRMEDALHGMEIDDDALEQSWRVGDWKVRIRDFWLNVAIARKKVWCDETNEKFEYDLVNWRQTQLVSVVEA